MPRPAPPPLCHCIWQCSSKDDYLDLIVVYMKYIKVSSLVVSNIISLQPCSPQVQSVGDMTYKPIRPYNIRRITSSICLARIYLVCFPSSGCGIITYRKLHFAKLSHNLFGYPNALGYIFS